MTPTHEFINQTLQVNLTNQSPVVPHTGGDIAVPNTGFVSQVMNNLGGLGYGLLIGALIALCLGIIIFACRRKLHHGFLRKIPRISFIVAAILVISGVLCSIPISIRMAQAIKTTENTVTIDLDIPDGQDSATASKDTNLTVSLDYEDGYVVFAHIDSEDDKLHNIDIRDAMFGPTQPATTIEKLSMNTYGIKNEQKNYVGLSKDEMHPTKVTRDEHKTTSGASIPITYAAKADTTMPVGLYKGAADAIHFEVAPDIYYLNYINYGPDGDHAVEQKHNNTFKLVEAAQNPGYEFKEYNTEADGSGTTYHPGDQFTVDYLEGTLYTIWQANKYNVTFNLNYPDAPNPEIKSETYDSYYVLPNQPQRTGYNFAGWWTDPKGGTEITAESKVTIAQDHTLYAHWVAQSYNVTFDQNYEGAPNPEVKSETYDSYYVLPNQPQRTGYTFKGWYTDKVKGTQITEKDLVKITSDQTLYAHWQVNTYKGTFDANEGVFPDGEKVKELTETYDSNYNLPKENPTRTGYTFAGWWTDKTGGTEIKSDTKVTTAQDHTIYAHWEENTYYLTYDANQGAGGPGTVTQKHNPSFTVTETPEPTREGYIFKGWADTATATAPQYDAGDPILLSEPAPGTTTSEKTLYAVWQLVYKVHYETNGDNVSRMPADQTSYDNVDSYTFQLTNLNDETIPIRPGYTFGGWTTVASNTAAAYSPGSELYRTKEHSQITLYTIWIATSDLGFGSLTGDNAKMQNMSGAVCSNVSIGTTGRLQDTRDYKIYNVTKEADGYCWMTQNLSLDLRKDKALTPTDSNVSANWTPERNTIPNGNLNTTTWTQDYTHPYSFNPADTYFVTNGATSGTDQKTAEGDAHYSAGNYYSWSAAVASNDTSEHTAKYENMPDSICPKGWRLPKITSDDSNDNELSSLFYKAGILKSDHRTYTENGFINIRKNPLWLVRSGFVGEDKLKSEGEGGDYWSSAIFHAEYAYLFNFDAGGTIPAFNVSRGTGRSVRCMTEATTYNLNYDANGGTGAPSSESQINNATFTISSTEPTRIGYDFKGWADSAGATQPQYYSGGSITLANPTTGSTSEKTIYAVWQAKEVTVTFDHNDGAGNTEDKTEIYNANYTFPENPKRTGYTFQGWFTDATGGTQVTSATKVTNPNKHTVYAHWEENTYNLVYNANEGTGGPGTVTQKHEPVFTISSVAPTREQYKFEGWADTPDATKVKYPVGDKITLDEPTSSTTSEKTIYAVWNKCNPGAGNISEAICMQDVNQSVRDSMTEGQTYQLKDSRDDKMYSIAKLKDGNVWMTQNLALGDADKSYVLDSTNSNLLIGQTFMLPAAQTSGTEDWACTSDASCRTARVYATGNESYGNFYSWYTATANTGTYSMIYGNATSSICPKGWRLPTGAKGGELDVLFDNFDRNATNFVNGTFFVFAGQYLKGHQQGSNNIWLSSTAGVVSAKNRAYALNGLSSPRVRIMPTGGADKENGMSIRCIARNDLVRTYVLHYDANGGTDAPDTQLQSDNPTFTLPTDKPTREGYDFRGWSTDPDATKVEYWPGASIDLPKPEPGAKTEQTLYAVWVEGCNPGATTIDRAKCMQDINADIKESMIEGKQYQLTDTRDGAKYYISRLRDGNVWMTQNLDLDLSTKRSLTPDDTNLSKTWIPEFDTIEHSSMSTWQHDAENPQSYDPGEEYIPTSGDNTDDRTYTTMQSCINAGHSETDCVHYHIGNLYNWVAATANNADSHSSICPKGWTLPDADYYTTVKTSDFSMMFFRQEIIGMPEAPVYTTNGFNAIRSNPIYWLRAGFIDKQHGEAKREDIGIGGNYWAGIADEITPGYALGATFRLDEIHGLLSTSKAYGYPVRCIFK